MWSEVGGTRLSGVMIYRGAAQNLVDYSWPFLDYSSCYSMRHASKAAVLDNKDASFTEGPQK